MSRGMAVALWICLSLFIAFVCNSAGAQAQTKGVETFFDSKIPGIRVQVSATSATQPTESIAFNLSLTPDINAEIKIALMNLTIYGFINGTEKVKVYTKSLGNFALTKAETYTDSFRVPEWVWGVAYGEIALNYNVTVVDQFGKHEYVFQNIVLGFTMTRIENVYLKSIEEQLASLRNAFERLNQTFVECFGRNLTRNELLNLNQTFWQLKQDYESLKDVRSELDNARTAMVFLAVVAIFFVATTAYLMFRKPKGYF